MWPPVKALNIEGNCGTIGIVKKLCNDGGNSTKHLLTVVNDSKN